MPPAKKAAPKPSSTRGSQATPTPANRGQQVRAGDATGMEQARLQRENAAAQKEAAQRMSLITSPVVEPVDEVVDYSGGGSAHIGAPQKSVSMDEALADGNTSTSFYDTPQADLDLDALPDGKTDVLPEIVDHSNEPPPASGPRRDSKQRVRQQSDEAPRVETREPVIEEVHRIMRVNTDLEDITIGKDNHFTFRVGVPYKVPAVVYDHLAEKGYVLA